ncbi:MAG: homoserine dehydrogenase [bacterium]|nr:homoserine dehydrogenase [bacterium]
MSKDALKVGLLGLGTVGSAVARRLVSDSGLEAAAGRPLILRRALVRDRERQRAFAPPRLELTADPDRVVGAPDIDAVVELMGGLEPAATYIRLALDAGQDVVTANKEVMAASGGNLLDLAARRAVSLSFEASVGGATPLVTPLKECLGTARVYALEGIVNATTNYILDRLGAGRSWETALAEAQAAGYAEADPSADVEGEDAARKLAILASIAFRGQLGLSAIRRRGIAGLDPVDIVFGAKHGWTLKLLVSARLIPGGVEASVEPVFLPNDHPLAGVSGVDNCVRAFTTVGTFCFSGPGAGGEATAVAVLGDLVRVARERGSPYRSSRCTCTQPLRPTPPSPARYYLRWSGSLPAAAAPPHGLHDGQQLVTGTIAPTVVDRYLADLPPGKAVAIRLYDQPMPGRV